MLIIPVFVHIWKKLYFVHWFKKYFMYFIFQIIILYRNDNKLFCTLLIIIILYRIKNENKIKIIFLCTLINIILCLFYYVQVLKIYFMYMMKKNFIVLWLLFLFVHWLDEKTTHFVLIKKYSFLYNENNYFFIIMKIKYFSVVGEN